MELKLFKHRQRKRDLLYWSADKVLAPLCRVDHEDILLVCFQWTISNVLLPFWRHLMTLPFYILLFYFRARILNRGSGLVDSPCSVCRHWPVLMSQILTVESALPETRMLSLSSMPLVSDWCPVSVWMQLPVSTSQTLIDVSREPLTTWIPSNYREQREFRPWASFTFPFSF